MAGGTAARQLAEVIPYALRHRSIVRSLRANLPIRLVAALHDTSVAMIERHYARYIVDGLEELLPALSCRWYRTLAAMLSRWPENSSTRKSLDARLSAANFLNY